MTDSYTLTSSLQVDQTAYDRLAYFALRPMLMFDTLATVKPTQQAMPGAVVSFTQFADLSVATTALNESTDVDAVAMSDGAVTVTLAEYGNAMITTAKLRGTSFIVLDPVVANIVGFNAGISLDTICRQRLQVGTNVRYGGSASGRTAVTPTSLATAAAVRRARAELVGATVMPFDGVNFAAIAHPDVLYDLKDQTGTNTWSDPHAYTTPENIWSGEFGRYSGFRFIENPRAPLFADAGSSTTLTDVYGTLFVGQEALAKAHSITDGNGPYPVTRMGTVTDKLLRFVPFGWYWLGDYGIFRQASIRRLETASSIGSNS